MKKKKLKKIIRNLRARLIRISCVCPECDNDELRLIGGHKISATARTNYMAVCGSCTYSAFVQLDSAFRFKDPSSQTIVSGEGSNIADA